MASKSDRSAEHPADYPTPFQKRIIWTGLAAFFTVLCGAIAVGLVGLLGWVLGYLQPILVPVAVAAILAYLLEPVIHWLRRKQKWRRDKAVYVVYGATLTLALLLAFLVIYPAVREGRQFWAEYLTPVPMSETTGTNAVQIAATAEDDPGWLSRTKLGSKGIELLGFLDERIGGLAALEQFKTQTAEEETRWDVGAIGTWLWNRFSRFLGEVTLFFGRGVSSAASLLGYFLGLFLVPIYLFFFLRESSTIARQWTDYIPLRESPLKSEIAETLREINGYLVAYFRGQMVVSIIDAVLVTIALGLIGLPYALLIGVFLAILGLIPYIGSVIVMIPSVIITVVHFGHKIVVPVAEAGRYEATRIAGKVLNDAGEVTAYQIYERTWDWLPNQIWLYPVIVILFFVILQQVNSLVTAPKIVGDAVGLHPLTVIFSILFWGLLLGGMLGALLAVPLTASVKVLFRRYIWVRKIQPGMATHRDSGPGNDGPAEVSRGALES